MESKKQIAAAKAAKKINLNGLYVDTYNKARENFPEITQETVEAIVVDRLKDLAWSADYCLHATEVLECIRGLQDFLKAYPEWHIRTHEGAGYAYWCTEKEGGGLISYEISPVEAVCCYSFFSTAQAGAK